jgi:hypothetical protein
MKRTFLTIAVLSLVTINHLSAQGVDLQQFIHETQQMRTGNNAFQLVWWIPTEYWKESFKNIPTLTEEQKNGIYKAVDHYIVLAVVDAKTTLLGSIIAASKDDIVYKLSLTIDQGPQMQPLLDSEVSSDANNLFAMMKPVIANMMGQFGQGMEFICFKGTDADGKKLLNPIKNGFLSVNLGDSTYKWRLPLGSLLPPKFDSKTGEKFPGNYAYNPFTGSNLTTVVTDKPTVNNEPK